MSELDLNWTIYYTPKNKDDVARVLSWLNEPVEPRRTQAAMSRATGKQKATISGVLTGRYPADPSSVLEALVDYVKRMTERNTNRSDVPFCETSVYKALSTVCRRAHQDRDFGVFAGRVGVGKTQALKRYCQQTPGTVLVDGLPGMSVRLLLDALLEKTSTAIRRSAPQTEKMAAIVATLTGSDRLLIVDEAELLNAVTLEYLRRISDASNVGVVLVGTPVLLALVRDPNGKFGQISSRIGLWPEIVQRITQDDCELLVRAFFDQAVDSEVVDECWRQSEGSARALRNLMRNTGRYAARHDRPIDATLIKQIADSTMAGIKGKWI